MGGAGPLGLAGRNITRMTYEQWDKVADSVNPLLVLALLVLPLVLRVRRPALHWLGALVAVGACELVAHVLRRLHWVPGKFPSTHFAFAAACLSALVILRPRWWPLWLGLGTGYGALMLYQRYHTWQEMAGALFAVPLAGWLYGRVIPPADAQEHGAKRIGLGETGGGARL